MIRVYEKTAAREGFRFFGNVKVGHDIEVADLERLYHAIVCTVGCGTDRHLGIPGEDLPGSHAATPPSSAGTTPTPTTPVPSSTSRTSARS